MNSKTSELTFGAMIVAIFSVMLLLNRQSGELFEEFIFFVLPLPMTWMIDCATHRMMVVRDKEMEDFRKVFDCSIEEGGLVDQPLELGDRVRVVEGSLKGVEGYVLELLGRTYVVVGLMGVLWARAQVPRAWLEKV